MTYRVFYIKIFQVLFIQFNKSLKKSHMPITEIPVLTKIEQQFVVLFCEEKTTQEIAEILEKSPRTVEDIRRRVKEKFQTKEVAGIVIGAIKYGYVKVRDETKEFVDV